VRGEIVDGKRTAKELNWTLLLFGSGGIRAGAAANGLLAD